MEEGSTHPVPTGVAGSFGSDLSPARLGEQLVSAVRAGAKRTAEAANGRDPAARLSPREVQVLAHLAAGSGQDDIAAALSVSSQTVRTHIQNAMVKLGAHSRREAVARARATGWLDGRPAGGAR